MVIPAMMRELNSKAFDEATRDLPLITGASATAFRPGQIVPVPQILGALKWVRAFKDSGMAGEVNIASLDVSSFTSLLVVTEQSNEISFAYADFERQIQGHVARGHDRKVVAHAPIREQLALGPCQERRVGFLGVLRIDGHLRLVPAAHPAELASGALELAAPLGELGVVFCDDRAQPPTLNRLRRKQLHLGAILGCELDDQPVEHQASSVGRAQPAGGPLDQALRLELVQPRVVKLPAVDGLEPRHVDAFGEAKAHEQIFVSRVLRG